MAVIFLVYRLTILKIFNDSHTFILLIDYCIILFTLLFYLLTILLSYSMTVTLLFYLLTFLLSYSTTVTLLFYLLTILLSYSMTVIALYVCKI